MKRYILVFLSLFFISINVSALNNIYIDKISVIESSEDVIVNNTENINITFNNVGETVRYKLDIINKNDLDYVIDYTDKLDYIDLKFDKTKINKNTTTEIYLDITYTDSINRSVNYNINDILKIKLIDNYKRSVIVKSIFIVILLLIIILVCSLISKIDSRKIFRIIVIGLLLIPVISLASNEYLKLDLNITINSNQLLPRCIHTNNNCIDWNKLNINRNNTSLITMKNKNFNNSFKYNNTEYVIDSMRDVSNNHNKQVILAIYKSNDSKSLLILGQNNGVVLPRNSSYLFMNTKFKVYDLNSIDSSYTTNMSHMFRGVITDSVDISRFDTSNVSVMNAMFYNSRINDVNMSDINVDNVRTINYMFMNSNINNLVGYKDLKFSKVKSKIRIFTNSNIKHIY